MNQRLDFCTLAALYDCGRLVPFIGSGMSMEACKSWPDFVEAIERQAGVDARATEKRDLPGRAAFAIQTLRRRGVAIGEAVRSAVYAEWPNRPSTHADKLARLYWPLVCTTNYDDVYLEAAYRRRHVLPTVRGRSEMDCRRLLQHVTMPVGEVVWALQGLLKPSDQVLHGCVGSDPERLEAELVVGHGEYRQAAHRAPHFRRAFAELFHNRALLFMGSGLEEAYLRTLFDEIIELVGPPVRPHFALVEEGKVDTDFMQQHYHIICATYPPGQHGRVTEFINDFAEYLRSARTRPGSWSYRMASPDNMGAENEALHFTVMRAPLPSPRQVGSNEVVAVSCGRERLAPALEAAMGVLGARGVPLPGGLGRSLLGEHDAGRVEWLDDWTVRWPGKDRLFGIVARQLEDFQSSRDARSPEAVRRAFKAFLGWAQRSGCKTAHVQLLAAGRSRVFFPWVSLVQMARAYGQWFKEQPAAVQPLSVVVYVVTPDVIALLNGGCIHMAEHLEDAPLRVNVEVIDAFGRSEQFHDIVQASARVDTLPVLGMVKDADPSISVHPTPRLNAMPMPLSELRKPALEVRDFGVVSGSTLVIDYRSSTRVTPPRAPA